MNKYLFKLTCAFVLVAIGGGR